MQRDANHEDFSNPYCPTCVTEHKILRVCMTDLHYLDSSHQNQVEVHQKSHCLYKPLNTADSFRSKVSDT